jgi:hypothetical protein
VEICIAALHEFDVSIAVMNIFWHFPANADIFARPAIRKE